MAGAIVLRALGALDLGLAAEHHARAFGPLGERVWTRRDIAELVAARCVSGLLLQIDGEEAGFALWCHAADEAELLTIAVRAAYRRRGGGRALLGAVVAAARDAGAAKLFLEVGADNSAAHRLYVEAGFAAVGQRPGYYERGPGPKADAIVMRLDLASDVHAQRRAGGATSGG